MNGFIVVGSNNIQDHIQIDLFEQYLKSENKIFKSHQINSNLFENTFGYQLFKENTSIDNTINANIFLNGKIFGKINNDNTKKLTYTESLKFVSENINQNSAFFGFDGSCSLVAVGNESFVFQNDIEGYKKVFYYESQGIICISSNLTYILKIIKKRWKIRKNAVFSYILQRESKWPLTFIEEIKLLPPLTKGILTENGISFENTILSDFYKLEKVGKKELLEDMYASYERIIKREDSKNVAVTLSGGFDSNCLAKLYSQSYNNKFTAVSLGYAAKRVNDANVYDESIYAEKIAKYLNIPFKRYFIDIEYFKSQIDSFIKTLDQPGHDPSSNFLLNDLLKKDGFDAVVTGMGGDALFSSKSSLKLTEHIYDIANFTGNYKFLNFISRHLKFKRHLRIFNSEQFIKSPRSFIELRELQKIRNASLDTYIDSNVKKHLFDEVAFRIDYYNRIEKTSNVQLEKYYSYALFSNPDEYHADIMAQRNGLNTIMPFASIAPVLKLLNGSKYHNISNRAFEMEIFKGINKELLLKRKSGFSFPYTEWVYDFFEEAINFFKEIHYFNEGSFDIDKFAKNYENDEHFRNNLSANQLIWKLTIIKRYLELHSLEL